MANYQIYREWSQKETISSDVRGQRRIQRLVPDNSKPKVTKITTGYNRGMQNHSSQHTPRGSLQILGYRKVRLRFTLVPKNWTAEDWENVA